jgi:hypothetical protein
MKKLDESQILRVVNNSLESQGYSARANSFKEGFGGMSHKNIWIALDDGSQMFLRWIDDFTRPIGRSGDNYFGGQCTLEREAKILNIAREQAGINAARVVALLDDAHLGKGLLVEKLEGIHFRDFLEKNNYSKSSFLRGLEYLGGEIAKAHKVNFDSYGAIYPEDILPGTDTYGGFLENILKRHLSGHDGLTSFYFTDNEFGEIADYLQGVISYAKNLGPHIKPSLVLYDQHSRNYLVHPESGKPTGFFDLEYGTASHPNLELGCLNIQLFGFFSGKYEREAREAFMKGYLDNNGPEYIDDTFLETAHTTNHLFSALKSYHGLSDGIRDGWSREFANMLLGVVRAGKVNCYDAFTDLIRPVTKQPTSPTDDN